ncbi:MAG: ribokinase [Clostridia bacterium]|nr:ribokinase [Clostridia bacterium]
MRKKIGVIGSVNVDIVSQTKNLPKVGETIIGDDFLISFGGKGANEAVASARLGASTTLFACVGDDMFSKNSIANLQQEGVHITAVKQIKNEKCGFANIVVSNKNNQIIVVPGANSRLDSAYIKKFTSRIKECSIIGGQFEIPVESLLLASRICKDNNIKFVLNPSPIKDYPKELFDNATYVVVNEIEIGYVDKSCKTADQVLKKYPFKVILTKGSQGCYYSDGKEVFNIPAISVDVVDTTGAGDTFLGSFMVAINGGLEFADAITFANVCAGLKTTKLGAQTGMPTMKQVEKYIKSNKIKINGLKEMEL